MGVTEFDSMYTKLAACKRRREQLAGEACNPYDCEIGWCSECQDALDAKKRTHKIRSRADSQNVAMSASHDQPAPGRARKHPGRRHP